MYTADDDTRPAKRVRKARLDHIEEANEAFLKQFSQLKPTGRPLRNFGPPALDSRGSSQSRDDISKQSLREKNSTKDEPQAKKESLTEQEKVRRVASVIAAAEKAAAEAKEREEQRIAAEKAAAEEEEARRQKRRADKAAKKRMSAEEKERLKENRLRKLIGAVVVQYFNKHAPRGDREKFKEYAKEVNHDGSSFASNALI